MNVTHYINTTESSVIAFVGYDTDEEKLAVQFHNGSESVYLDVPLNEFTGFAVADSLGVYYNRYIKGLYDTDTNAVVMFAPHVMNLTGTPRGDVERLFATPEAVTESDDKSVTESDNDLEAVLAGSRFNLTFELADQGRFFSETFTRDEATAVYAALKPFGWTVSLDEHGA